jgi:hypothetical protein
MHEQIRCLLQSDLYRGSKTEPSFLFRILFLESKMKQSWKLLKRY